MKSKDVEHSLEEYCKRLIDVFKARIKEEPPEFVVEEYKAIINIVDSLSKFMYSSLKLLEERIGRIFKNLENELRNVVAKELYGKLEDKSLREIINFARQSAATYLIIPVIPRKRLVGEIDELSIEDLLTVMKVIRTPTNALWEHYFEEILDRFKELSCTEMLKVYENLKEILYSYYGAFEYRYSKHFKKLIVHLSKYLPRCKLSEAKNFIYDVGTVLVEFTFSEDRKNIIDSIVKVILKEENVDIIMEILETQPYCNFLNYLSTKEIVKIVSSVLNKIIENPLSVEHVRIINLLSKYRLGPLRAKDLKEWEIDEKLKSIWQRALMILETTEDFAQYVMLYLKLKESLLTYYLEEYTDAKVKLPQLEYMHLRRLLIKSIEAGRSYYELSNTISLLRRINKELSRKLRSNLRYYYRKLRGT